MSPFPFLLSSIVIVSSSIIEFIVDTQTADTCSQRGKARDEVRRGDNGNVAVSTLEHHIYYLSGVLLPVVV